MEIKNAKSGNNASYGKEISSNRGKGNQSGFPARREAPEYAPKKPLVHRGSRRAFFHDYCAPNRYLITATVNPGSPILSAMPDLKPDQLRKGEMIIPIHTPLGMAIKNDILAGNPPPAIPNSTK